MAKRSAVEEAPGAPSPKRLQTDNLSQLYLDDPDDDFSTAQTPSSAADADSPATAATTPRAKFPSDLKTLICSWPGCPKTFNRPARLRDHLNSHTNSRPFRCPYEDCEKDYIEDKHLKQHIKAVHTHERKHVCEREGCGKSFVTGTRLKRHQAVHEGADRFRCEDCGQSFRKKETLTKHVRSEHLGKPAHLCPQSGCDQAFISKGALNRHKEKEHGEIKYWCDECGAKVSEEGGTGRRVGFTTEVLLQAHLKRDHQNCMFCDFKAAGQWDMERHVEMHHSGKSIEDRKTEPCPYAGCSKKFTKRSNLNAHIRSAHEGFRFLCGQVDVSGPLLEDWTNDQGCGAKYASKAKLEEHIRFVHLGQDRPKLSRPDVDRSAHLVDDVSGITNEARQTILCPDCDATFIRYADLATHTDAEHSASLTAFSPPKHSDSSLPLFDQDLGQVDWAEDSPQEEIFAAQMDYGPPQDDWLDDEANILLLARETEEAESHIDPALPVS